MGGIEGQWKRKWKLLFENAPERSSFLSCEGITVLNAATREGTVDFLLLRDVLAKDFGALQMLRGMFYMIWTWAYQIERLQVLGT